MYRGAVLFPPWLPPRYFFTLLDDGVGMNASADISDAGLLDGSEDLDSSENLTYTPGTGLPPVDVCRVVTKAYPVLEIDVP